MRLHRSLIGLLVAPLTVLGAVAFSGCSTGDSSHDHATHSHDATSGHASSGHASMPIGNPHPGHCPVMGGEVADDAAANPALVSVHDGKRFVFCCDHCKPEFEKDPAKWIASPAAPKADGHAH